MKRLLALIMSSLICSGLYAEQIIIGTSPFNPPMGMQATKNNVFTGFEIDLLNEACRRINATCAYQPMAFEEIMKALLAEKLDLGIAGFFITKERLAYYLFSKPYLQTKAQLFTTVDTDINSSNVNTGKRIGIEVGTVFKSILLQRYDNVKIISYDNQPDMLQDLADHKIDLIMFDFIGAAYWVNNNQRIYKFVGDAIPFGMGYGIMANQKQSALVIRINNALNEMEKDGTYIAIYSRYF